MLTYCARSPELNCFSLILRITGVCNFNCPYCDINSTHSLTFDQCKSIVDKVHTVAKNRNIEFYLTGGEPTVMPYFLDLIDYIYKIDNLHSIIFDTNFTGVTDKYLNYMDKIFIRWSIHKETDFSNLSLYREMIKRSDKVHARLLYSPDTKDFIHSIIHYFEDDPNCQIVFIRPHDINFLEQERDFVEQFHKGKVFHKQYGFNICDNNEIKTVSRTSMLEKNFKGLLCHARLDGVAIDERGFVYSCISEKIPKFNILNCSIDKFINFTSKPVICRYNRCACEVYYKKYYNNEVLKEVEKCLNG